METIIESVVPIGSAEGRPKKYSNRNQLQRDIEKYFVECDKKEKVYTFAGLARALGLSRSNFFEWKEKDLEFRDIIQDACNRVITQVEEFILTRPSGHVGLIFWLKNIGRESFVDKQEIINTGNERMVINVLSYKDTDKYMKVIDTPSKSL